MMRSRTPVRVSELAEEAATCRDDEHGFGRKIKCGRSVASEGGFRRTWAYGRSDFEFVAPHDSTGDHSGDPHHGLGVVAAHDDQPDGTHRGSHAHPGGSGPGGGGRGRAGAYRV